MNLEELKQKLNDGYKLYSFMIFDEDINAGIWVEVDTDKFISKLALTNYPSSFFLKHVSVNNKNIYIG